MASKENEDPAAVNAHALAAARAVDTSQSARSQSFSAVAYRYGCAYGYRPPPHGQSSMSSVSSVSSMSAYGKPPQPPLGLQISGVLPPGEHERRSASPRPAYVYAKPRPHLYAWGNNGEDADADDAEVDALNTSACVRLRGERTLITDMIAKFQGQLRNIDPALWPLADEGKKAGRKKR